ncbi:ABC transporter ATP-binding protein [Parenemella sanctibonifatiensis]|uniref:ABC transporter ATP-binding protein n=1 Tax=Parenemella sanctibonifatiensis TaxID=2016505 RepID=UPI001E4EBEA6|nr:ABC transporter ATP-binding protein [Parenemella sanctibonifatiensis]
MTSSSATPAAPILSVRGLGVERANRWIVDGVDLEVRAGELLALLGPNGAGKTTTIRCCTGVWQPDRGDVAVAGEAPSRAAAAAAIGFMPQSAGAWSGIKAGELLRYFAGLYADPLPLPPLVEALGLTAVLRTPYRHLSGGQQQATNLIAAVVGRPQLALLDEPTAGMDPRARRTTWELMAQLRDAGVAVLLTTHALDEAEELADRIAIMDRGRIRLTGTPAELLADRTLEQLYLDHTSEAAA